MFWFLLILPFLLLVLLIFLPIKIFLKADFQDNFIDFILKFFWIFPFPKIKIEVPYEYFSREIFVFGKESCTITEKTTETEKKIEPKLVLQGKNFPIKKIWKFLKFTSSLTSIRANGKLGLGNPATSGLVSGFLFTLNGFKKLNFQVVPDVLNFGYKGSVEINFSLFLAKGLIFLAKDFFKNFAGKR